MMKICPSSDISRKGIFLSAVLLTIVFLLLIANASVSAQDQSPVHILVLDSYNPFQPWSQAFYEGLAEIQQTSDRPILLYLEYIDKLRLSDGIDYADLYTYLKDKYKNIGLSGIIADSYYAAEFIYEYGSALVGDGPKVTYTSQPNPAISGDPSYFSLQGENEKSVMETVKIALDQNPKARSVLIIQGKDNFSRDSVGILVQLLEGYASLSVRILSDFSMEELVRTVAGLDRNTIVFSTLVTSDNTGRFLVPRDVVEEIAASSPAPIYSFWSTFINTGAVGGRMLDGRVVGSQLVAAVLDYLRDGRFKDSYGTLHTYIDWKALDRYGIKPASIPGDATVINRPINLWSEYRIELITIGICLALLAIAAVFWLRKLSVLNVKLRRSRDELEIRVEERTRELAQSNRDLTVSEKRFRGIIENAPIGIALVDTDGRLKLTNPAMERVLGYSSEEFTKMVFTEFTHPEDADKDMALYRELVEDQRDHYAIEKRYIHKTGKIIHAELNVAAVRDDNRALLAVIGMAQDVTKRKQAEKDLRLAHERFSTVLNSLEALVYVSDMKTYEILFINKYGRDNWGECVGKACWQVLQNQQTGPCSFCTNDKLIDSAGKPTGVYEWEFQNTVTKQWYHMQDQAIEWFDGRLVRLQIATDITKKIETEKEREKLISELQKTLSEVKTLRGFLPICSSCKKIRDDKGYWSQIESYISKHSDAEFSHGICPDCAKELYRDLYEGLGKGASQTKHDGS